VGNSDSAGSVSNRMGTTTTSRSVAARVESLFEAHIDSVFNVGYRVLWNRADAEDVAQRTFLKALQRLDQIEDDRRERAWLLQIAYREAIASMRKRREVPTAPDKFPVVPAPGACPAEAAIAAEVASRLAVALAAMRDDERIAVVLRDVEGLPMRDVAEVLGIGHSAAKMRVNRGRSSLRQLVRNAGVI